MKKMGDLGLLGITKPTQYGGLGLDYSYEVVFAQALGHCSCGSLPMAIGVQTDMATPALARFGSSDLRKEYLEPAIKGDMVRSEEHTSELQSLMRISYAVFCLTKKKSNTSK